MPKIFISYRREDSEYSSQHIHQRLVDEFGSESVVFDVDLLPYVTGAGQRDALDAQRLPESEGAINSLMFSPVGQ